MRACMGTSLAATAAALGIRRATTAAGPAATVATDQQHSSTAPAACSWPTAPHIKSTEPAGI